MSPASPGRPVPSRFEPLTPEWLTETLRRGGWISDGPVTAVRETVIGEGRGFPGRITRLELTYDHPEPGAPATVIAKRPTQRRGFTERTATHRIFEREVRFYQELAAECTLVTPRCYYAAMDVDFGSHLLLLEDLTSMREGDDIESCSPEEMELAVAEVARFHARWWDSPRLAGLDWVPLWSDDADFYQDALTQLWPRFLHRVPGPIPPRVRAVGERLAPNFARMMRQLAEPPLTLVHSDFRLDNLFFAKAHGQPALAVVDWATIQRGRPAFDLAKLIVWGLPVERRRHREPGLLRGYLDRLATHGVTGYDFRDLLLDYRLSVFVLLTDLVGLVASVDFEPGREQRLRDALIERNFAAVGDHDLAGLLPF